MCGMFSGVYVFMYIYVLAVVDDVRRRREEASKQSLRRDRFSLTSLLMRRRCALSTRDLVLCV